jgi:hypothetical protein
MQELLLKLPQLQLLSLAAPESHRVMNAAAKSSVKVLLKLQMILQAFNGTAADELPLLQLVEGVVCTQPEAAQAMATALMNPK